MTQEPSEIEMITYIECNFVKLQDSPHLLHIAAMLLKPHEATWAAVQASLSKEANVPTEEQRPMYVRIPLPHDNPALVRNLYRLVFGATDSSLRIATTGNYTPQFHVGSPFEARDIRL